MGWLKATILSAFLVFAPIKATIITVFVLCVVDLILGIIAAKKRKEKITSADLRRTVTKLFVFEVVLLVSFLAETYLSLDTIFPASKTAAALIASVELLSIYENLNEISGNNLLSSLIEKLGSKNVHKK